MRRLSTFRSRLLLAAAFGIASGSGAGFAFQASGPTLPTAPTAVEPAPVDDGLAVADYLYNAAAHTDGDAAPDTTGAFRFTCGAGMARVNGRPVYTATIDPIVFPGQPGKSHEHQFYGNNGVNANSTYQTLRTTGDTTCHNILNRSAYWVPAMRNGLGKVIRPDYVSIYYKRIPKSNPACITENINRCIQLPRGLRYIFGYNMALGRRGGGYAHWNVQGGTSVSGAYADIVEAATHIDPVNGLLGATISAPQCWDGKNLDSPDHHSHMADAINGDGDIKIPNDPNKRVCPDTHPWIIAHFVLIEWFKVDSTLDRSGTWTPGVTKTWELSSDNMYGMPRKRPGSTLHADWFGAWNDQVLKMWHDNCIDRQLNCANGDLGNGKGLMNIAGEPYNPQPRIVPMAPMSMEPFRAKIGPTK